MPKTVVGLFEDPGKINGVVRDIEALGFPRQEVRSLTEPLSFEVTGVMSFPKLDFEVDVARGLTRIGASTVEARAFVDGLRHGGALVFATGPDAKVESAAAIMNREGAVAIETGAGPEPQMPGLDRTNNTPILDGPVLAGRIRESGGGACVFVW